MIVKLEHWYLNTVTGTLSLNEDGNCGDSVTLDHTPLELLLCLIRYQGQDVTKDTMLGEVWPNKVVSEDVLSVGISQIRKALGDNARKPTFIKTIPSIGYRLIAHVDNVETNQVSEYKLGPNKPVEFHRTRTLNSWKIVASALTLVIVIYLLFTNKAQVTLDDFPSAKSIEHYQKARYLLAQDNEEDWKIAEQSFEDTIIKVPNYAPAYRELVNAKLKVIGWSNGIGKYEQLEELYYLLNKSLTLAPDDVETHLVMADVAFMVEWNFPLANKHFKKAVELDPKHSHAHFQYSQFLLAAEEFELAIKHIQIYVDLEPSGYAVPSVAWVYNMMEDFPTARAELEKLRNLEPGSFYYHVSAQAIYENMGDEATSFKELYKVLEMSKYTEQELHAVAAAFKDGGLAEVNRWLLEDKKEQAYIGQYEPPLSYARYAIKAGKLELAVEYIKQALADRNQILLWFNVDPKYKPIRNHPDLKDMINPTSKQE